MEKVRINNDLLVKYTVLRDGQPESFVGATDITVTVTNEAYKKAIPNTFAISGNVVNINIDAKDFNLCGKYRVTLKYVRGNDIEIDALAFEGVPYTSLTGGTEIVGVEVVTVNISGDIGIAIPDNNKIDLDGLNSAIKRLQFDTINPAAGTQAGQVYWSDEEKTLVLNDGYHTHPLGKELGPLVKNNSGQTILNGQACYVIGSTGDNPTIGLASTSNGDVAQKTIGLATMDIPNNGFGIVTTFGEVNDINTSSLTQGGLIYLGLNGSLTTTEPASPTPKIIVGICVRQHATVGKIFVATRPIPRLSKLSDVYTTTMADGEVLRWNTTTLRFEQFNLTTALDGKVNNTGNEGISGIKTFNNSPLMPTPTTSMQGANKGYVDSVGASAVHLTGNETIAGIKTFASSPIVPTPTTDMQASTKKYADDLNATAVHKTGAETIDGVKTFNASPIIPAPTTNLQPTTKKYVDDADAQLRADLNTTGFDVNNKKISIVANTSSYTSMSVKLYAGRRYKIVNTTNYVANFRDSNNLIVVYAQKNTIYESITIPRDVVLINGVFGTGVVEVEPLDIIKPHSFRDKILHSSVLGLCSFIEEIHIIDYEKYDSFKILISTSNTFIRLIGVKNGISTNITGYIYYNNWKPGDIIPLESVGYIIANKNYVPYGDFVEYDLTNVRLEDNPTIRLYLYSTNDTFIKYITVNSDPLAVADFVGNNAIQQAIDSISDASEKNQYVIRCTGNFLFSKITDYRYSAGSGIWSAIWGKNYVHIDGISSNNCILRSELSDVLTNVQSDVPIGGQPFVKDSYGMVMLCQWNVNSNISNVTLIARNIRYPLHTDGSEFGCQNYEETYKNCILSHEGKFGDAIGTNGGSASGFGLSSGQKIIFENCKFDTTHYCHTNKDYVDGALAIYKDCEFIAKKASITNGIGAICLDSPVKSNFIFERCRFDKNSFVTLNTALYNYTNPIAEKVADINVIARDVEPMPIYSASTNCKVLRITSLSTGVSSNVRFVGESTAFNYIVGDNSIETETTDNLFRKCKLGYKYREGGVGLKGYAQGQWNIHEGSVRGYYVTALGKRLGNCLSVNKALTVIIDSISYNIVFNKDYTNLTNAEIIAEINSVIGSVAIAESVNVNRDWYPDFGYTEVLVNGDSTAILRGMGVVISSGNLRRAKNSDGYIDGIALNDAAPNGYCRFMTRGRLSISGLSNYIIYRVPGQQTEYYNVAENSKWGISTANDGMFDIDSIPKLVKKTYNDSCEIIR